MVEPVRASPWRRRVWWLVVAAILVAVGLRVSDLILSAREPAPTAGFGAGGRAGAAVSVRIEPAAVAAVEVRSTMTGTLEAEYEIDVFPQRSGRLASVAVDVGRRVAAGDVLAVVEHDELLLQREQAAASVSVSQASVRRAETQLERAREDYERTEQLYRRGAATQQELQRVQGVLDEAQIQLDSARAQLAQAEANYRLVELQLERVHVTAPVPGVVVSRPVVAGSQVSPSTSVATLAAMDPIEVVFHLPEREMGRVGVDQPIFVAVDAFPDRMFSGRVSQVGAAVDPRTRTVTVRGRVDNPDLTLRPGMFARVELVLARKEGVLSVPREAVLQGPQGPYVYVVEGNQAVTRPLTVGLEGSERVEVLAGVREGEPVVVVGQHRLRPGRTVVPMGSEWDDAVQSGRPAGAGGQNR